MFDQVDLPAAEPFLDPLFALDGIADVVMGFMPDEPPDPVFAGEAADRAVAMLGDPGDEVARDAGVERAVAVRSEEVDRREEVGVNEGAALLGAIRLGR